MTVHDGAQLRIGKRAKRTCACDVHRVEEQYPGYSRRTFGCRSCDGTMTEWGPYAKRRPIFSLSSDYLAEADQHPDEELTHFYRLTI